MPPRIIECPHTVEVPTIDVASFVFSSGTLESRQIPQYFDADSPSRCYSLSQAEAYVKRIAKGFQKFGLQPDDKVLLFSSNSLYFPVLFWSVVAARCVFTSVNPGASETELEYQLRDSEAKILLAHPSVFQTALAAARRVGLPATHVYSFTDPDANETDANRPIRPWTDLWCSSEETSEWKWHRITSLEEAQSTTAVLNYSSGTTGPPKGVEISHYNAVANCVQLVHKRGLVGDTEPARRRKARLRLSGERWLAPLPMYHAYGQTYYCMNAARLGAKVYIMSKYNLGKLLLYADTYRITFLTVVPVIVNMMARQASAARYNLQSVENVICGSAPLNPEVADNVARRYLRDGVRIMQGLGMTECTCSVTQFAPDDKDDGRSVGWLNANCRAQLREIVGEEFSGSAPSGRAVGELWLSGPNIMKGYYKRPQQTEESIHVDNDGMRWLKTGDIGYVDDKGRFYLVDRMKDLIKVKGLQVSPAELELALLEHPDVTDAAVVGAKRPDGEYPQAFVVRKSATVSGDDLQRLIEARFARHKWLAAGVHFVDVIPRTASGKIIRRALRDRYSSGRL
ncbi:hypothetical protein BJY01DRAFT_240202 [Aspergillus pseudoustus]|uniref:Acetyl-CoA synthetase-like protein n=1 Tax=Aspergillus pseudoustus TaxID=1810923 RepID=A0ABR4ITE4_9EURO